MKRFWDMEEPFDRVPAIIHTPNPRTGRTDGYFFGRLDDFINSFEEYYKEHAEVMDELMPKLAPQYGHAIIAGICGSPIHAASETVWSAPIIDDLRQADELHLNWDNQWGRNLREDYEILFERAKGKFVVGEYEIEGVSDTISALRGAENMLYDFHEDPEWAHKLAGRVTDILIEFGKWNNENIGDRQDLLGGIATAYNLWMPKGSCCTTEDASVMLSPEYYQENIQQHTSRLTSSFTKTLMEVHDEGLHQVGNFGKMGGIDLLNISNPLKMDERHRESVRHLLGRKNFFIRMSPDENIGDTLEFTGLKGIILEFEVTSIKEAKETLADIERQTQIRLSK